MSRHLQMLLALLGGILIGGLAVGVVAFRALDGAVILLAAELDRRASRETVQAWCKKDYRRGALHGWMQLQVTPGLRPAELDGFPHTIRSMLVLSRLSIARVDNPHADRQGLAFRRARVAVMLERAGFTELADEQWNQAAQVFAEGGHSFSRERFARSNDDSCARLSGKPDGP